MPDAELHLRIVALLALAHSVVGGIALLHLHLLLLADDVAVAALFQVVPVLSVVQLRAGLALRLPVPGAVPCHEGARRALLAGELLVRLGVPPLVGGLQAGAQLSQEEEERGKHPLQHSEELLASARPLPEAEATKAPAAPPALCAPPQQGLALPPASLPPQPPRKAAAGPGAPPTMQPGG